MARETTAASKLLHSPMLLDWTAAILDERITALLTKRNSAKRRSDVSKAARDE